jgi:hypothetical protein
VRFEWEKYRRSHEGQVEAVGQKFEIKWTSTGALLCLLDETMLHRIRIGFLFGFLSYAAVGGWGLHPRLQPG